ncbi:predicted protein [Nematostella vectensis]|uniref:Uncharacterized protein n=1 Tax=Nematostella vectensis TaxID=45351 RepID=A7RX88_NEMVE|nr:mitochondrial carnitine/acylcarnitine carrier protein [Nematostella vectensis]EDO43921.1 predicted protein [Nematostella vectensis]|eukprot:XP_001635984.1 predicted protein [Nematostella vectensis]
MTNKGDPDTDGRANARRLSPARNLIAGSVSGMLGCAAGQPLDLLKVRLQAMNQVKPGETAPFKGAMDCFMKTVRLEGLRGLYKGMLSPLLMATPSTALTFYSLSVGKRIQLSDPYQEPTLVQYGNAGLFCGFCVSFLFAPAERIKCILQVEAGASGSTQSGPYAIVKRIYAEEGVRGIFRGLPPTMIRDTFGTGVWYLTYEGLLMLMRSEGTSRDDIGTLQIVSAGGIAGLALWGLMFPVDMLKTRVQIAPMGRYPRGARDVLKEVLCNEGPMALYKGYVPGMIRAVVTHCGLFIGYEFTMKAMNYIEP